MIEELPIKKLNGVSVIICTYNGAKRLPETLRHLALQQVNPDLPWEIILVDNVSTDNSKETAITEWAKHDSKVELRIVDQPIPGKQPALEKGYEHARYEYLITCDDDNWLCNNYIETCAKLMKANNNIGVLGGYSEAVSDGDLPGWFSKFQRNYAVGPQSGKNGDITWKEGYVWGAGMVVRKSAIDELFAGGYKSILPCRKGDQLSAGGDTEMCYALRLAGWKIWYDSSLKLKHFISKNKLTWSFLRQLNRGYGAQKIGFDSYLKVFDPEPKNFNQSFKKKWIFLTIMLIKKLRSYGIRKLLKFNKSSEGDSEILRIEKSIGRLREILKIRGQYTIQMETVKNAPWRKVFSLDRV